MFKQRYLKILLLFLIGVALFFIYLNRDKISNLKDLHSLLEFIKEHGKYAGVCFILIFSLKPILLIIPSAMLSISGGVIFGPIAGFLLNMIGFFISGTLAFFISRILGKSFVDRILKGKIIDLNNNLEKNGFRVLFLLRLPPVLPYDPLSYTCGLTKIKYLDFIAASLLGVIPETLCYSFMGENILNPFSLKFIIPLAIIIIATATSGFVFSKTKKLT